MVKRSFATLTALAAALTLAGCSSTCFKETPAQQVATFEFVIKEIDANKHERVLQRPRIAAQALLQRLAAVRGRLSLCADQAAAAKW
ncbi:hypothetical protein OFD58_34425, partial [Pseudomonas aeruginosa]|uniref:hypothetical protein n=1 Tax=Pseudomonas aeruginosa TaxID=287 RepID=UPI0021F0D1CF